MQAICLAIITVGTLFYTVYKAKIIPNTVKNPVFYVVIGLLLGIMSSFLGIGGGPINLVVLHFFFAMDSKTAAANSLYIIMFSQFTSLISTIVSGKVPAFDPFVLVLMVLGGIFGGMIGRYINKKINNAVVDKLFIGMMAVIILICVYNSYKYLVI